MALLAFDGFDNYNAAANDLLNRRGGGMQWTSFSGSVTGPGRAGVGSYASMGQNQSLVATLSASLGSGFFGFALEVPGVAPDETGPPSFVLTDAHSGTNQVTVALNQSRMGFDVYRAVSPHAVLIAQSANNVITADAWNYIEIMATISTTAGAVTIRVNGEIALTASGLDTQVSSNAFFDTVSFNAPGAPTATVINVDDVYFADTTTGPGPYSFATFVGDVRVETLNPTGNGATIAWTPLTGANWQEVSEVHCDDDASYNATATVGATDLFNFAALGESINAILAVQIMGCYRKDDAGYHTINQQLVSGSTTVAGAAYAIPIGYVYVADFWTTDPNTALAAWSQSAVNALQAGYKLTA